MESSQTQVNPKTWCTDHHMPMPDCFYEHHKPVEEEKDIIVLPCRHGIPDTTGTIICGECGRKWLITIEKGATAAREQRE